MALKAHVVENETWQEIIFINDDQIRDSFYIRRNSSTGEFPTLDIFFETEGSHHQFGKYGCISVAADIVEIAEFDYNDDDNNPIFSADIEFDINKYEISEDEIKIDLFLGF